MSDDIRVFKTITGEDIIAEVTDVINESNESWYHIKNPANLVLQETEQGVRVGLAPFMPFAEEGSVILYTGSLVAEARPDPAMLKEYKRVYSPIVVPTSSIITSR